MAKYKKISKDDQAKLKELKEAFDQIILSGRAKLGIKQNESIVQSKSFRIEDSFAFTENAITFVIYNKDDPLQEKIVNDTIRICNDLMEQAYSIKQKYGYENIRSMNAPKKEEPTFFGDELIITLSVNQTKKIRPFDDEKITEWREKDYLSFGDFWALVEDNGLSEFLGFTYIANDLRVKIQNEKQFSLNNGVFIGIGEHQKVNLNLRVNNVHSVKRQDYLGDQRTFFEIKNKQNKVLNIYAKNEHPDTKTTLKSLEEMYQMNFKI